MIVVYFSSENGMVISQLVGPDLAGFPEPGGGMLAMMLEEPANLPGYMLDGCFNPLPARPTQHHEFDYATKQWVDPRTLDDLKAEKWAAVKAARDAQEFGPFSWGALTFDGDAESKSRLSLAAMAAQAAIASGQVWEVDWTLADNSTVTLSATDVIGVVQSMGANITAAHQNARIKRAAIEASQTIEELDAI